MLLSDESAPVRAKNELENEKNLRVWSWKELSLSDLCSLLLISAAGERLKAAAASSTQIFD